MKIWGTSPESIDEAEDRDKWYKILTRLDIKQPPGDMVTSEAGAIKVATGLGYPVMVRPSFVLGGRAMEIVYGCAHRLPLPHHLTHGSDITAAGTRPLQFSCYHSQPPACIQAPVRGFVAPAHIPAATFKPCRGAQTQAPVTRHLSVMHSDLALEHG